MHKYTAFILNKVASFAKTVVGVAELNKLMHATCYLCLCNLPRIIYIFNFFRRWLTIMKTRETWDLWTKTPKVWGQVW